MMSILRALIRHTMDTDTVLKVSDQWESPERNKIENDKENHPQGVVFCWVRTPGIEPGTSRVSVVCSTS